MATKNPPVPSNFDDQLEALISRTRAEGWDKKFSIDVNGMEKGLVAHRKAKPKDVELRQTYEQHHKGFSLDQTALYQQYVKTVGMLRAAHKDQPEVLCSLDCFKRKGGGSRRKKEPTPPVVDPVKPAVP